MKEFMEQAVGSAGPRVEYFGAAQGAALAEHFAWCDVVASPGHIGLLAVNAAQHGRPLVIQDNVVHAPEVIVAREAGQVFIDFECEDRVDALIERIKNDRQWLADLGKELQRVGVEGYTIEHMVARHVEVFDKVASHASAR
jgi:glycosyltransferase involved in cell wall biosynthesis